MIRFTATSVLAFVMALPPVVEIPILPAESHCVVVVVGQEKSGELVTTDPICLGTEGLAAFLALATFNRAFITTA